MKPPHRALFHLDARGELHDVLAVAEGLRRGRAVGAMWRDVSGGVRACVGTHAHERARRERERKAATYEGVLLDIGNKGVHMHLFDEGAKLVEVDEELADPHLVVLVVERGDGGGGLRRCARRRRGQRAERKQRERDGLGITKE